MSVERVTAGKSELRKDAWEKVSGKAKYIADMVPEDMRYGALLRSPHHHARIIKIDAAETKKIPGVIAVLTSDDVPGEKVFGPLIQDRPVLAFDVVRHMGEPVALVVAETERSAKLALEAISVDYEPLPAVFEPKAAIEASAPQVHAAGNLLTQYDVKDGDIQAGFRDADIILEETFHVPRISPAYLEPESAMAQRNEDGTLTVWVSSQKPFDDRHHIASILGLPEDRVQVIGAVVGGAFGGKEDSGLPTLAALAAWATGATVRLVNSRHESFLAHPKRHPARLEYKLGAKRDGTLTALEATIYMDTGAYASYGPAVGGLLTEMVTGAYQIPNVHVNTSVVYTNSPFSGAMRGFGSPQAHFATESMIDELAARLQIDPLELRHKNILKPDDHLFTRVIIGETANSLPQILEHAATERKRLRRIKPSPGKVSGVGIAFSTQSMGLGHGVPDDATNRLEWQPDGSVLLYLGAPDLGQGLATIAEQLAAEALGLPYDAVHTVAIDTQISPDGGVSCASRMTYMTGNSVMLAAQKLVDDLLDYAAKALHRPREQLSYRKGMIFLPEGDQISLSEFTRRAADDGMTLKSEATFSFPYPVETTPTHLPIGMPHVMFCYGAQVVRVEIDPELGTIEVKDLVAIHDVGKAINRAGVEGQIEGGAVMGIGYALYEDVRMKENGRWVDSFTEYLLPTSLDVPPNFKSIILEVPEKSGPRGAKGVGEMGLVPTAPAIANAVYDATSIRVRSIPILPAAIMASLSQ